MARKKKLPVSKKHSALMPKLAWQKLIQKLMAEHGFKHKYRFADAIDVCHQTISRWLGDNPPLPEPKSFMKVAGSLKISERQLAEMWLAVMNEDSTAYSRGHDAGGEVREPTATYDEMWVVADAKAIEDLDLRDVPVEQRPFLHQHRREILELVREIEELKLRLAARLRATLATFRELYGSAVDTTRLRLPYGG